MDKLLSFLSWCMAHWMEVLLGIQGFIVSALVLAKLAPGDQPDKALIWLNSQLGLITKK